MLAYVRQWFVGSALHLIGPIPWGHSGPLCHALSLSSLSSMSRTSMRRLVNGRETARSSEWAQHFSNAYFLFVDSGCPAFGAPVMGDAV